MNRRLKPSIASTTRLTYLARVMPLWCGVLGWVGWQAPSAVEFRNAANIVDADAVFAAINAFRSDPSSYVPLLQARLDATDERKVLHLPDTLPLMVCVCARARVCVCGCVTVCGGCVWLCVTVVTLWDWGVAYSLTLCFLGVPVHDQTVDGRIDARGSVCH